jgi:hypothetical protein
MIGCILNQRREPAIILKSAISIHHSAIGIHHSSRPGGHLRVSPVSNRLAGAVL